MCSPNGLFLQGGYAPLQPPIPYPLTLPVIMTVVTMTSYNEKLFL